MIDTLQINKFSKLHDGINIIFCKTEFLPEEFENIKKIKKDVTLISGNSDFVIDENVFSLMPKNVKKWFAQNPMFTNEIIQAIPIGIANYLPSVRKGHGIGLGSRVKVQENVIDNYKDKIPEKFIYANFNLYTNLSHRTEIKNICASTEFIDWEEPTLSDENFLYKLLDYEAIVCPQGNGLGDNHRIYETLYMNRIPITFNRIMYDNLHHLFPVVLIEKNEDLSDYKTMRSKIDDAKNKKWNSSVLEMDYWIEKIINGKS